METVQTRLLRKLQRLLPNRNALVAIRKGMRAVKICTNKILLFFNWMCQIMQVDLYSGNKTVAVVLLY